MFSETYQWLTQLLSSSESAQMVFVGGATFLVSWLFFTGIKAIIGEYAKRWFFSRKSTSSLELREKNVIRMERDLEARAAMLTTKTLISKGVVLSRWEIAHIIPPKTDVSDDSDAA